MAWQTRIHILPFCGHHFQVHVFHWNLLLMVKLKNGHHRPRKWVEYDNETSHHLNQLKSNSLTYIIVTKPRSWYSRGRHIESNTTWCSIQHCSDSCMHKLELSFTKDISYLTLSDELWASWQIRKIAGCACTGRFTRHRGLTIPTCITARAWRTCPDACRDR